jgi:hypothetical protein
MENQINSPAGNIPPVNPPNQKNRSSSPILSLGIFTIVLFISTMILAYQNLQLRHQTASRQTSPPAVVVVSPTPKSVQTAVPPTGWNIYMDNQLNYTFNYPSAYTLTGITDVSSDRSVTDTAASVLQIQKITPKNSDAYTPTARFYFIKGINTVNLTGQVEDIKFNPQKNAWVDENPDGETILPVWAYTKNGSEIIKGTNGGSEGSSYYYVIPDYQHDTAAIFLIPQSYRIRCDSLSGSVQTACTNFYTSVIKKYNNGQTIMDTWLPETYIQSLYTGAESMISGFEFISR